MLYPLNLYGDVCEFFLSKTVKNGWNSSLFQKWDGHNCIVHEEKKEQVPLSHHIHKNKV